MTWLEWIVVCGWVGLIARESYCYGYQKRDREAFDERMDKIRRDREQQ